MSNSFQLTFTHLLLMKYYLKHLRGILFKDFSKQYTLRPRYPAKKYGRIPELAGYRGCW